MALSQHPIDHAQKRARSTNGLCGLGVRKLSARSSLHQAPLSFFHAVSRVPPRNLLKKVKFIIRREELGRLPDTEAGLLHYSTPHSQRLLFRSVRVCDGFVVDPGLPSRVLLNQTLQDDH
jgi:hypothetical protein